MRASQIKIRIAAAMIAASAAQGEPLYQQDGITLEGTAQIEVRDAGVCQVSADHNSSEAYERMKANHGKPLHVWRLRFAVRNGSGRNLEHLTAHFSIASEAPPCTDWSGPLGNYAKPVQWANSFQVLQKPDGMEPDEEVSDTVFVLAFHDRQPEFESWNVDYRFAEEAGREVEPALGAPAFIVVAVPTHANVSLLNTAQPYRRRMPLEPGRYQVEVSAPGYGTQRVWLDHKQTWPHRIELERLPGGDDRVSRNSPSGTASGELPPEIMADRYLLKAEQAVRDQDVGVARLAMEQLHAVRQEHGLEPAPEDHFRYAKAWEAAKEPVRAMEAAVRYLQLRGQEAAHYTETLELMNRVESGKAALPSPTEVEAEPVASRNSDKPEPETAAGSARELARVPPPDVAGESAPLGDPASSQIAARDANCEAWGDSSGYFFITATVAEVRACLEAGSDPNANLQYNIRPLHQAAFVNDDPEIIQALAAAGASPNAMDISGDTPLHNAATYGAPLEVVQELLAAGANPLAKNDSGRTPSQIASRRKKKYPKIAQALADAAKTAEDGLESSLGPAACKNWNREQFFEIEGYTIFDGHGKGPAKVRACLDAGYDSMARDGNGLTPLHLAVAYPREEMAEILLAAGADPMAQDIDGRTPLHVTESERAIRALVAAGADPMARDSDGRRPLHVTESEPAIKALVAAGADPMARDSDGRTPLHLAAVEIGNAETVAALLAAGADLESRDHEGRTPLHLAALDDGWPKSMEVLLDAGAHRLAQDNEGRTPLDLVDGFNQKQKAKKARFLAHTGTNRGGGKGDGRAFGALMAGLTAAAVGAASGLDTNDALEVGTSVAESVLTGQATVGSTGGGAVPNGSGLAGGGSCLIPGYPSPPGGLAGVGLSWCPASVDFQVRSFALQAAGIQCAVAAASPARPEVVSQARGQISEVCGRLAAMSARDGTNCRCPAGFGP